MSPPDEASKAPTTDITAETAEGAAAFVQHVKDNAESFFEAQGEVTPFGIFLARRDRDSKKLDRPGVMAVAIDTDFMSDEEAKDRLVTALRSVATSTEAYAWAFMGEAWIAAAHKGQTEHRASKLPDRKEIVFATFQHIAVDQPYGAFAPIIRPTDGSKPHLGEWQAMQVQPSSRFAIIVLENHKTRPTLQSLYAMMKTVGPKDPAEAKFRANKAFDLFVEQHKIPAELREAARARFMAEMEEEGFF